MRKRRVWEEPFPLCPELVMLGFDDVRSAIPLEEHRHERSFEFVYVEKGRAAWKIGRDTYETLAGDVFHTRPDETHSGRFDVIEPCRLWWLILRVPEGRGSRWLELPEAEAELVLARLWTLPRMVTPDAPVLAIFRKLKDALEAPKAWAGLEIRHAVLGLLLVLLREEKPLGRVEPGEPVIRELAGRLAEYPAWRPSVPELASLAGMSESHFYRQFHRVTGLSPMAYGERIRIEEACRRLQHSLESVTSMALDLGFTSSQHFATVFRRVTGRSPREWRRLTAAGVLLPVEGEQLSGRPDGLG
ncbi:AraC family transcriptional regulator [Paenibacillus sp. CC-CFT747]|nr:AraC family transcriptional regulator [Paenibacillus sp. CC-CFT747]